MASAVPDAAARVKSPYHRGGVLSLELFISYRREDTSGYALGLRREFAEKLASVNVFVDSQSIDAGTRWRETIRDRLSECDAMLVLIGDEWLVTRDGQKKIEDENDPVRFELKRVLDREDIVVIPVLLEHAKMPSARDLPTDVRRLCEFAADAIHDVTYSQDVTRLIERLSRIAETKDPPPVGPQAPAASPLNPETDRTWPARITKRFLQQEVSGMGRDQLLALIAELQRRRWTETEIFDGALSFSPLQPLKRLPARITPAWLATNVPLLSPTRVRHLTTEMQRRGWSADQIRRHVYEYRQGGLAEEIPARIHSAWVERNSPLMTIAEQAHLGDVMLERGWAPEVVKHHLPCALA